MSEQPEVEALLTGMVEALEPIIRRDGRDRVAMIGIHTGGVWLAERLHQALALGTPLGTLDISFYRDDFARVGLNPQVRPSALPFEVEGRGIILVDDVPYTGRTIRAAMNEIFDYGRPAALRLAVLVDRGGRELPIAADVTGINLHLAPGEHIKLRGPEPLALHREHRPA